MNNSKPNSMWTKFRFFDIVSSLLMALIFFGLGYMLGQSRLAPLNFIGPAADTPAEAREAFAPFWEVWQLVNNNHLNQPLDQELLAEGAINGMLETLEDPYTNYLPPSSQEAAEASFEGQIEGIGAEVQNIDGDITIISPYDGSPAAEAGLLPQDIIRLVDGVDITGFDILDAANLVRGPAGSDVSLTIERDGETFTIVVTRGVIDIASVRTEELENGLLLIRLSQFGERTAEELEEALQQLETGSIRGLVLDLRRNPGGSLTTVVDVADQFLAGGIIITEEYASGRVDQIEATEEGLALDIPMIVVVDEGSASAAEVLAGSLRDQERALLVGTPTFGKGTVQSWSNLRNGGGVRITVARWLTPAGTWVHETGLLPDIVVELPADATGNPLEDPQLGAAVEQLLRQLEQTDQAANHDFLN